MRFSSPEKQAVKQSASVMKALQGKHIRSVRTVRNYEQCLRTVARILAENRQSLKDLTRETAAQYLVDRAVEVGQSQLNMERQALQAMMQHVTHELAPNETLNVEKSDLKEVLASRAYAPEQVALVAERQTDRNALSTEIAHAAGLRAHELLTIRPTDERAPDVRPALEQKFENREAERSYTVVGKGGLCREIRLPDHLADRLEDRRLDEPVEVTDRGIHYEQHYDIGGGQAWSQSFSDAAERALGWSEGAHGLRHSYAQERMVELQRAEYSYQTALAVVSQEMGHFRPEITEVYLR